MLLFAFSACTPENKSVTEPLTPEETEEIDKKYPGFSYNYETYIYPKVNKLSKSSSFYLKLKKLTYADFMDFIQNSYNCMNRNGKNRLRRKLYKNGIKSST